jgi:hypothetical protein
MTYTKKPEIPVNLVRHENDDTYRIVDNISMFRMKAERRVYFEKTRVGRGMVGSFYVEVE